MALNRDAVLPVLVTAIGGAGHGEQVLKALRLAQPGRYRIYGADANPRCPQFDLVDRSYVLPRADHPNYMDELLGLCAELGVKAVFHGCEPELKLWSRERARFAAAGLFLTINPADVIDTCMDKVRTAKRLAELGFDPPRFAAVNHARDLDQIDFFPVVLKPSIGGGGSANCYIAQDRTELNALGTLLHLEEARQSFMIQEYCGTADCEYTVGVLHDMDGKFINSIGIKRQLSSQLNVRLTVQNRTARSDLGPQLVISSGVSQGFVDRFPAVTGQCEEIAKGLGARGPINIQCRFVEGKVKVFEVNPRYSGTTSIRAMMGYNEPDILLRRHLLGEDVAPRFAYESGLVLRSLTESIVVDDESQKRLRSAS